MNEREHRKFEELVIKGTHLAFQKLVRERKKTDSELVFARNGRVFKVKASDLD